MKNMRCKSAILVAHNEPLVIDELEIPKLKPGQVLVKISYSGVCHTQLLEWKGKRGKDPYLPHCLGHEGSGIVVEVGPGVKKIKPKDFVILSWIKGQGQDVCGSVYKWGGKLVNAGAITTFSEYAVISENRITPISFKVSLKEAALVGCALATGLGSVFHMASPKAGQSLAVLGCGGIGLLALQGAVISGCFPIIAIDISSFKLEIAKKMGATHVIDASRSDPVLEIKKICELDFAIEATGNALVMNQALESVRPRGGTAVIVGNVQHGKTWNVDPKQLNLGKKILGTWGGESFPDKHYAEYCQLIDQKKLQLDLLTKHIYSLEEINQALKDLDKGKVTRAIVKMNSNLEE